MSDDGYPTANDVSGYYSDDFEDLLYDADPEQDLADDLASHALHSPIFHDDPGYELQDYHSDWEYYSDDYYDDDPAILKDNPQDGSPIRSRIQGRDGPQRGKKRKLVDVQDIPDLDLGERKTLKDCMRGTVWAKPIPERDNTFVPGKGDKIALLRDWKSVFGTTSVQDRAGFQKHPLPDDESWANDMSLADMGLRNERGSIVEKQGGENAAELEEEEEDDDREARAIEFDDETAATLLQQMEGMDEKDAAALFQQLQGQVPNEAASAIPQMKRAKKPHPLAEAQSNSPSSMDRINEPLAVLPKRRKQNNDVLPSPPQSNQSPILEQSDATAPLPVKEEDKSPLQDQQRGRDRPRNGSRAAGPERTTSASTINSTRGTKRKASMSASPERGEGVSRTTTRSRTKRVSTSVKGAGAETPGRENSGTNVSTRSARSRKKP